MEMIPLKTQLMKGPFCFMDELKRAIRKNHIQFEDGDILVISGKFLAMSEGRYVNLEEIVPLKDSEAYASQYKISAALAETVIRESDLVLKGLQGFLLTIKDGFFAPNAGVDRSNIQKGMAILHPSDASAFAAQIRREVLLILGVKVGVVITDSRLLPLRRGTGGVSIGSSGIITVADDRGREDLFGNRMKVTRRAIADNLSTAAQLLMGESDENIPIVIVRGLETYIIDEDGYDLSINPNECIFVRGLTNYKDIRS